MARTAGAQGTQDKPSRKSKPSQRKDTGGKHIPQGIINFREKQALPQRELEVRQNRRKEAARREAEEIQVSGLGWLP
jgi:hypothetical protein